MKTLNTVLGQLLPQMLQNFRLWNFFQHCRETPEVHTPELVATRLPYVFFKQTIICTMH